MRERLVATFVGVAAAAVAIAWLGAHVLDSLLGHVSVLVLLLVAAGGVGWIVASRLTRALERAASHVEGMQRRDHAVTVTASHELRTPITALRLSLEDLTLWRQTPPDVADELKRSIGELDRLSAAITRLLDVHHEDALAERGAVDLSALVADVVATWRPTLTPGRSATLDLPVALHVRLEAAPVTQLLITLLDAAGRRGAGAVRVDLTPMGPTVRVRVSDESPRRVAPGVIHAPALDVTAGEHELAEAAELAEAMGGYISVEDSEQTSIALILPATKTASPA
ncbi:MAG: hypothetical protein JWP31_2449 [Aeromicrobium sp.]|nr:hypothetical protein [Aeromicrobium sp.]